MSKLLNRDNKVAVLYQRAEECWTKGELNAAFKLFLAAAKAGFVPAFDIIACFYGDGVGTKVDQGASLYWYMRSYRETSSWYRNAHSTAANNIGCILRDRGEEKKAISWFQRAVKLGDGDANLNIARIYLRNGGNRRNAIHYLQKTIKAPYVTDGSIEEAKALLKQIHTKSLRHSKVD